MFSQNGIILFGLLFISIVKASNLLNLTLVHQHPNPEAVVHELQRRVNDSTSRRLLSGSSKSQCQTGNPIDDCWRCDPNWSDNRQRLADCAIGFGQKAMGGKGGRFYVVSDSSDRDTVNPTPGTLRHAVIQDEPLWIVFKSNMEIKLKHELIVNNYKTLDGRGANVQITGYGCITLQYVSNVIIHNVGVYGCKPSGNTNIRSSPTHVGYRGRSDGDGISIFSSRNIWIDHCSLSQCTDGLVDAIMGSTGITISNSYFSEHDEVMLLGHDDKYLPDSGMQVTIAFNHFGKGLVQRMPRCRRGYIHVVNNDFSEWKMYAIGGSANPTINSQGNRYTAPGDLNAKEVTKRVDTNEGVWSDWNWRSEGDAMVNGAYFVPSGAGAGVSMQYAKASSVEAKSSTLVDQLTSNAGVLGGGARDNGGMNIQYGEGTTTGASSYGEGGSNNGNVNGIGGPGGSENEYWGMIFGSAGSPSHSSPTSPYNLSLLIILIFYLTTNHGGLLLSCTSSNECGKFYSKSKAYIG